MSNSPLPRSIPLAPESSYDQPHALARTSVAIGHRISVWLSRCASSLILFVRISRQVSDSLRGYIKTLRAKRWTDLGPWYDVLPCGCLVPNERTIARSLGMKELKSRYPWASTVECSMFLEGFDKGEQFALHTWSKPKQVSSSTSHSERCNLQVDMLKRQWYKSQYESTGHQNPNKSDQLLDRGLLDSRHGSHDRSRKEHGCKATS